MTEEKATATLSEKCQYCGDELDDQNKRVEVKVSWRGYSQSSITCSDNCAINNHFSKGMKDIIEDESMKAESRAELHLKAEIREKIEALPKRLISEIPSDYWIEKKAVLAILSQGEKQ